MAGLLYGGNVVSSGIWVSLTGCVAQMANDNDGAWTQSEWWDPGLSFMVYYSISLLFIRGR